MCNVGTFDKFFRGLVGLVVFGLGLVFGSWWGLIGIIPVATAVFQFCPLYAPLHINTGCKA